jgi:hypothetical protein
MGLNRRIRIRCLLASLGFSFWSGLWSLVPFGIRIVAFGVSFVPLLLFGPWWFFSALFAAAAAFF